MSAAKRGKRGWRVESGGVQRSWLAASESRESESWLEKCKPKWHWGSQLKLSSFNALHKRQTIEARGKGGGEWLQETRVRHTTGNNCCSKRQQQQQHRVQTTNKQLTSAFAVLRAS